jgi:SAM-dependent methyltransferase
MYAEIMDVLQVPSFPVALKNPLHAIYLLRDVRNPKHQYANRFVRIVGALGPGVDQAVAIPILAEFYATGRVKTETIGRDIALAFSSKFTDPALQQQFPLLNAPALKRLYAQTTDQLAAELPRLNIQVVEAIYAAACEVVAPVVPPDPTAQEAPPPAAPSAITLPQYIDEFIFGLGGLGGVRARNRVGVRSGLAANDERQRAYLGTYFPRSFAESYSIFHALFANQHITRAIPAKRGVLSVLNIGSGTGGDTVGLLEAVAASGHRPARIDIHSVEGNPIALTYQRKIVETVAAMRGLNVQLITHEVVFPTTRAGFEERLSQLLTTLPTSFDLVLTWKSLNEYYHANLASAHGIYRAFLEILGPALAPRGLCALLDVADSVNDDRVHWFPIMMNSEVKAYLQTPGATLGHVLPLSCANWAHLCTTPQCYTQRVFYVSHSQEACVECKTVYKIMAHREFAVTLTQHQRQGRRYRCNTAQPRQMCAQGTIVRIAATTTVPDGFELN